MSDRKPEPTLADARMLECVHFTGIQHDVCKAGVRYVDVRDTSTKPFGFPCLARFAGNATCAKRQTPTREEAEAEERAFEASFKRINACLKAIRAKHGKSRGLVDSMPCPNDCGGTLRYSIAEYNGHVHGACSTEGCASWMQ